MTGRLVHWVAGKPWDGAGEVSTPVCDPASGQIIASVPHASHDDVGVALTAARDAFVGWRRAPLSRRMQVLFEFRALVLHHVEELAEIITAEHGKVLEDARGEVLRGLEVVDFACGIAHLLTARASEDVSRDVDTEEVRQPLGVCLGITPFNFPVMVPMWMHPLAIACGNAFVLKPSEKDPSASLRVAELWAEAGLPEGVFTVVHGGQATVEALLTHPDVAAVSFVGSTPVARKVYATASTHGKRVQALGGAKNHMVVLPDTDLAVAADAAVGAAFGSAGERCMAISVVVAVEPIGHDLVEAIRRRAAALAVGPGSTPGSQMGPLVSAEHRDRVAASVDAGVTAGARLVLDGRDLVVPGHQDGFWLGPCLFDHVTPDMTIYAEEIFGPFLSVLRVPDLDAALEVINANPFGNGASIFTRDGAAARRFKHEVEAGMVGVNVPIPVPMAYYSFGGWKASAFGDLRMHGLDGVGFYTRGKVVTARWPRFSAGADLAFPRSA